MMFESPGLPAPNPTQLSSQRWPAPASQNWGGGEGGGSHMVPGVWIVTGA